MKPLVFRRESVLRGARRGGRARGIALLQLTHCRHGHPLTEDNISFCGTHRICLTCRRIREALRRQRLRDGNK